VFNNVESKRNLWIFQASLECAKATELEKLQAITEMTDLIRHVASNF
jgi:hypothetical protein